MLLGRIAEIAGASLEGDPSVPIDGVCGLEDARPGDLSFLSSPRYASQLATTKATAVILAPGVEAPTHVQVLRARDPYVAFVQLLPHFEPPRSEARPGVHPSAVVAGNVRLGEGASIGALAMVEEDVSIGARTRVGSGCVIGRGTVVGDDCTLHPRVVIMHGCILGQRVIVHPGAVIGADGFGYTFADGAYRKVPQVGTVEIADDVEVGANACIDRATIGRTRIGRGTKIDNLVQLAHNSAVGEGCAFASQSGVAGSTKFGDGVRIGGQAGIGGHLRIGDGVTIGGQGGVIGDVEAGATITGYPARDHKTMMRVHAAMMQLPEMIRRLRRLERNAPGRSDPSED